MERDSLLQTLVGAVLGHSNEHRKQCEQQLKELEKHQGFTAYLLDLLSESDPVVRLAAAIVFRIRVGRCWVPQGGSGGRAAANDLGAILDQEKTLIKTKLIESLLKVSKDHKLRAQLTLALSSILNNEKWSEIEDIIKSLLSDVNNTDHLYVGLMVLFEYSKCYRWSDKMPNEGANPVLESIATEIFPYVENIAKQLLSQDTLLSDEMLYMILKIYKYVTYSDIPLYLVDNPTNLGNWCQLHLNIINAPLPKIVIELDPADRPLHPRIKAIKHSFGNLERMLRLHAATGRKKDFKFAQVYMSAIVPDIVNSYYKVIEQWSSKQLWLSEASVFHLTNFLELLLDSEGWTLIKDQLDAILRLLIIPTLSASETSIELYGDDPEDYIRRYLDIGRFWSTADIGADNFIFRLSSKRFDASVNLLLAAVSDIFNKRAANRNDLEAAKHAEAAIRILSTISTSLEKNSSPVKGQLDKIAHTFIVPELLQDTISNTPWLTARACDFFACAIINYPDQSVVQDVFQGIAYCAQQADHLPIQIKAFDALGQLVPEPYVAAQVAPQAPQLMNTLLELSKKFESEILNDVMDIIVENFPANLEPYANELSSNLVAQFMKLAGEILENSSNSGMSYEISEPSGSSEIDIEKESQATGVLVTLSTLVKSMSHNPEVATNLAHSLKGVLEFILENAMVEFLASAIELMKIIVDTGKTVLPVIWELYDICLGSFQTYGFDYFDAFEMFFEAIINHGFIKEDIKMDSPRVQGLFQICLKIIGNADDSVNTYDAEIAFSLIELSILALGERIRSSIPGLMSQTFDIFKRMENNDVFDGEMLDHLLVLRVFFACIYIDASASLQVLASNQFLPSFYKLWIKNSEDFRSVHGCKLQILASGAILFNSSALSFVPKEYVSETVDLLLDNLEALPGAIRARDALLTDGNPRAASDYTEGAYYDDFNDDAELEASKITPLENVDAGTTAVHSIVTLQSNDPQHFQAVFGYISDKQKDFLQRISQRQ
ncbi:uncharacterized protein KQ657_003259 [Scheffersomyces spartinae]|uniref:Importin N-terminal domain-containing protein n=1 Tax=Scheffersomyces spartinae TaxID=45513 RepID=A0A9P8AK39_9ASCO|nr:uncharacterized protein KQ657_003259 [Scheffersomyces spartinae]KAG7195496.1 hypothetical protein KQ657_003259 [Scheffersomyces spartinae]